MKDYVAPGVLAALMMGGFAMMSAQMNGVRSDLTAEIRDVRNDVDQVRAEVGAVRAEVGSVRAEVGSVRAGLAGTQAEVAGMGAELVAVRNELADFRARLRAVEIGFGKVDQRLLTLERVLLPGRESPGE